MIAFLDSSALIYLTEGHEPFAARMRATVHSITEQHADIGLAISRLTWLECRVGPMKRDDAATLGRYDAFFARPDVSWVELTRDVVELAAAVRVRHGLRTPDALQAACCLQLGREHRMLTGDASFQRVAGLNVVRLD
ncbi:MAG: PIN domain-containing protein [Rhodocyclaceae bacterium]|nr:PIN domain-containing protein [Rhodocyclaceae bacterium]MCA3105336.1 PIN domain-containing protein [Rhodocyclaceae bacterium]MCA3119587.1 PIN domain-containing protein [Rhodocyclaceae bacterium]MCA3149817.1 PIN domain-containing protein [Rhodocyclaceae bacterium]MCA4903976.1 PIN domain-containing protein [Rhodocyclaceae bacterium]